MEKVHLILRNLITRLYNSSYSIVFTLVCQIIDTTKKRNSRLTWRWVTWLRLVSCTSFTPTSLYASFTSTRCISSRSRSTISNYVLIISKIVVSHLQVPTPVPRPWDALVLYSVQPIVIFSKVVHVYVLLGDELRDWDLSVALVSRPRVCTLVSHPQDALVLDPVQPLVTTY